MNLIEALKHIEEHGSGDKALALIEEAAIGLVELYENLGLADISPASAADQCDALYDLLNRVGLPVA